jgi:RNA polymerase sigma factor (sigma-70 family)
LRDPAKAEDMVQEAFLAALKGAKGFQGRSAEKSWLVGILKNKICDHYRKASRETSFTVWSSIQMRRATVSFQTSRSRTAEFTQLVRKAESVRMRIVESLQKRWVVWVWNHTPNCAEMSRLASQSFEKPLPLGTRFKMRLHYVVCVWCSRYQKHLKFLRAAAPRLEEHLSLPAARGLSVQAKQRIVQRLQIG